MSKTITITQTRSTIGRNQRQRDTLRSLGINRIGQSSTHKDSAQLRGKLRTIEHLVVWKEEQHG
jgi:large subunit ribosomal protein L30